MGPGYYPEAYPCDAITISGFVKDIISLPSVYQLLKMSAPGCECGSVDKYRIDIRTVVTVKVTLYLLLTTCSLV
jgi:hypothetical protein